MSDSDSPHNDAAAHQREMRLPHPGWFLLAAMLLLVAFGCLQVWLPQRKLDLFVKEVAAMEGEVDIQPAEPFRLVDGMGYEIDLGFKEAAAVSLIRSPVSDAWLERLKEVPRLRSLSLRGPGVTDAGLAHLASLPRLEFLMLIDCPKVTPAGEEALLRTLQRLRIDRRGPVLLGVSCHPSDPQGCVVSHTPAGYPAQRAGILRGDIIRKLNGNPVADFATLVQMLSVFKPGDIVTLDVQRGDEPLKFEIPLEPWR